MMWLAIAAAIVAVVVLLVLVTRSRGPNSGAPRARDVGPTNSANADAHGAHTQHRGNIYGGGGGGLPF